MVNFIASIMVFAVAVLSLIGSAPTHNLKRDKRLGLTILALATAFFLIKLFT
jgi:hypothetical protein